jgi:RNA-binding protein YhbY
MLDITSDQRRALRARAHALNPVVAISQNGLVRIRFDRDKHQP